MSLRNGLVAYWDLQTNSKDVLGKYNTSTNAVVFNGKEFKVTSASGYIENNSIASIFSNKKDFTISLAIKIDSAMLSRTLANIFTIGTQNYWGGGQVEIYPRWESSTSSLKVGTEGYSAGDTNRIDYPFKIGKEFIITFKSKDGVLYFYNDGLLIGSLNIPGSYSFNYFTIGNEVMPSYRNRAIDQNTTIKNFTVYERAISDTELTRLVRQKGNPLTPNKILSPLFYTTPPEHPTVTTSSVTNIATNSGLGNGNVTDDGNATITERGICWNTSPNPTTADSKSIATGTTGAFSADIHSLTTGTTYYVRAYATNSVGTSYGSEVTFSPSQVSLQQESGGFIKQENGRTFIF